MFFAWFLYCMIFVCLFLCSCLFFVIKIAQTFTFIIQRTDLVFIKRRRKTTRNSLLSSSSSCYSDRWSLKWVQVIELGNVPTITNVQLSPLARMLTKSTLYVFWSLHTCNNRTVNFVGLAPKMRNDLMTYIYIYTFHPDATFSFQWELNSKSQPINLFGVFCFCFLFLFGHLNCLTTRELSGWVEG